MKKIIRSLYAVSILLLLLLLFLFTGCGEKHKVQPVESDTTRRDAEGRTPLINAVIAGNEAEVSRLIAAGAGLLLHDTTGSSAYDYAELGESAIIKKNLLMVGEPVNKAYWISTPDGLSFKKEPVLESETISVIPFATEVMVIKRSYFPVTIGEAEGRWCEVEWEGTVGWLYDAYLTDDQSNLRRTGNYIFYRNTEDEIWAYNMKTGKDVFTGIETDSSSGGVMGMGIIHPIYSLESSMIAYLGANERKHLTVNIHDFSESNSMAVYEEISLDDDSHEYGAEDAYTQFYLSCWTGNGNYLVFYAREPGFPDKSGFYSYNTETGQLTRLYQVKSVQCCINGTNRIICNGTKIYDLYTDEMKTVSGLTGSDPLQLDGYGEIVAFNTMDNGIYFLNLAMGETVEIPNSYECSWPRVLPDQENIIYEDNEDGIYMYNIESGISEKFYSGPANSVMYVLNEWIVACNSLKQGLPKTTINAINYKTKEKIKITDSGDKYQ